MTSATPHRCDNACICPVHGTPLIFAPFIEDHACQNADCTYGLGFDPSGAGFDDGTRRYIFIAARWAHGHLKLMDNCALCRAESNEARIYHAQYGG